MSDYSTKPSNSAKVKLPSLKHLELLNKNGYYEKTSTYPDTCMKTPSWRHNLMAWCKETSFEEYVQISNIISSSNLVATPVTILSPPQQSRNINNTYSTFSPIRGNHHLPPPRQFTSPFQLQNFNQYAMSSSSFYNTTPARCDSQSLNSGVDFMTGAQVEFQPPTQTENKSLGVLASIASNILVDNNPPPSSTVKPADQFYKLSNYSNCESLYSTSLNKNKPSLSPRQQTPPTSPRMNFDNKNQVLFTPTLSNKMIKKHSVDLGHKKTNSFKARQLKKILNNRNVLNGSSLDNNIVIRTENQESLSNDEIKKMKEYQKNKKTSLEGNKPILSYEDTNKATGTFYNVHTPSPPMSPGKKLNQMAKFPSYDFTTTLIETNSPLSLKNSPEQNMSAIKSSTASSINSSPKAYNKKSSRSSSNGTHKTYKFHQCMSCKTKDSPCWRPSWSKSKKEQLCNSCGLRYKKSKIRCTNNLCLKIPSLSEAHIMKNSPEMKCLFCTSEVEIGGSK